MAQSDCGLEHCNELFNCSGLIAIEHASYYANGVPALAKAAVYRGTAGKMAERWQKNLGSSPGMGEADFGKAKIDAQKGEAGFGKKIAVSHVTTGKVMQPDSG